MLKNFDRRMFLSGVGAAGLGLALPEEMLASGYSGPIAHEIAQGEQQTQSPKYRIKFAVAGMSHDHIYGMVGAIQRGGGELVMAHGTEPDKIAAFKRRFPDVKWAATEDEILHEPSIRLVLSSKIPNERAPLGCRVLRAGKDFLSDKPGITTLEQLAEVRRTIAATKRIYGILYSERFEVPAAVKAGDLVQQGAIGRVIQTINIAPHQIYQKPGDNGGGGSRPDWFWIDEQAGGILCDIGSHQLDQFLFYTGSTEAEVVASQISNVAHRDHPQFHDFGDMMLRGNRGFGYVRLDWFTPRGLGTWGDGRLFILGTEGYIEVRKYTNVAASPKGNNLFIVDQKQARYIDCNNVPLPFGSQFVSDVVNRTHTAQNQTEALLAAELSIKAQKNAARVKLEG